MIDHALKLALIDRMNSKGFVRIIFLLQQGKTFADLLGVGGIETGAAEEESHVMPFDIMSDGFPHKWNEWPVAKILPRTRTPELQQLTVEFLNLVQVEFPFRVKTD